MPTPNIPVVNKGLMYVTGLQVAQGTINVANVSSNFLLISAGQARDSTDTNDITLPATLTTAQALANGNPNNVPIDANAPFYTLNPLISGRVNALDTGALAAAVTLYAVYAISDSTSYRQPGTLLSLSFSNPVLPFGYDGFRRIGAVLSNAAGTAILAFNQRGLNQLRQTYYMVDLATLVVAGNSTALADVVLTTWVPSTAARVYLKSVLTADAGATRTVVYVADRSVTIANGATGEVIMSSPASTVTSSSLCVPVTSAAAVQTCQYAVSNGAAAVAVNVEGFEDQL